MSGRERIRGEGLSYTYLTRTGETLALKDLDLTIRDGEFCSIVGPSGCGKSTLLGIISGLLQPTEGQVLLDGVTMRGTHERVGILLQKRFAAEATPRRDAARTSCWNRMASPVLKTPIRISSPAACVSAWR